MARKYQRGHRLRPRGNPARSFRHARENAQWWVGSTQTEAVYINGDPLRGAYSWTFIEPPFPCWVVYRAADGTIKERAQ